VHIEFLVEDSSGGKLLEILLPKLLGGHGNSHTWKIITYKGIGKIPKNLTPTGDPTKRILLDKLPRLLRGYGKTSYVDGIVVVLDSNARNCGDFLDELNNLAENCGALQYTVFRLAMEEIEAWYLGDEVALRAAYPKIKLGVLKKYTQDKPCGTWELLADAIYPGGSASIIKNGWPLAGQIKHEWAKKIGPMLDLKRMLPQVLPSFVVEYYALLTEDRKNAMLRRSGYWYEDD
jgi:hypothetical protein